MTYLAPIGSRYFIKDASGNILMSKSGYRSKQSAGRAMWFYNNGRSAMVAGYKMRMREEEEHFKNI